MNRPAGLGREFPIRLLALVIDSTLVGDDLVLRERTLEAVRAAVRRGVSVSIVTGRMVSSAMGFAQELGLRDPIVGFQGALIRAMPDRSGRRLGRLLVNHPLPAATARDAVRFCRGRDLDPSMGTVGGEVRRDAIGPVGAYRTASRQRVSTVRDDAVGQTSGAAYAEAQTQWSTVVRTTIGIRGDLYGWDVEADDPLNGGTASDGIVNPKFSVAFGPWRRTELYASAGSGFHSNDGRGATIHRDPVSGDPVEPVDPLIRARGAEVGLRTLALPRVHTTLAVWGLWLDSELLFIGDAGTTEASRPSRRVGVEWDADYRAIFCLGYKFPFVSERVTYD